MYKFKVYIYLIRVPFCACQKSYGFKNLIKLECWQTNFKITIGRTVFRKSCLKYVKVVNLKNFELFVYVPKSSMYKFKVHIYLICVPFCAGQKSCGIKNQMKLGRSQTDFKITIGRTVFRKSCSTSKFAGVGAIFDIFLVFFVQNREIKQAKYS